MGIAEEDVARVRAATDFVHLAGEHMALRRVGTRWSGLCPFHGEKTPSFSINAEQGLYYCFGCGAKGDVITFVRETEHLDFVEAVEKLAARAGIALRYDDAAAGHEHQQRSRLHDALGAAIEWYHQRLLSAADAAPARAYLRGERGYDGELVRRYQLGWAPEGWDTLVRALRLPDDVLREAGLAFLNRTGRTTDSFRGRLLFPIFDAAGKPVGIGGRILPGGEGPKYKNTAETPIYSKSRVLYGLNWAKKAVVETGEVVVCEGYTDVIGLHQAGVTHAVATCGTALADGHVRLLTNFARRIVLAYDADAAGQAAAERFYEWERKFEVDIVVAALPAGADPADLARRDPAALKGLVAGARPFLAFRLDRALGRADLHEPEGRVRAAAAAMAVVEEHPSELVRDQYVMQIADRCQIDPERLRSGAWRSWAGGSNGRARGGATQTDGGPAVRQRARVTDPAGPELEALRLAVHRPESVASRLEEALFADEPYLAVFRALASAATLHDAISGADPEAADLLQRLAVEEAEEDPDDVMIRLLERSGARVLVDLQREARGAPSPEQYAPVIGWLKLTIEELRNPQTREDAEARLVPWLVARREGADE
ncbi:MAG TPA: DNA primase [Acidimicrobiales bacterium]|nr:DNA primase [Acidimicrobiales bacterium]